MNLKIVGIWLLRCLSVRERKEERLLWVPVGCLGEGEVEEAYGGGEECEAVVCRTVGVPAGIV